MTTPETREEIRREVRVMLAMARPDQLRRLLQDVLSGSDDTGRTA